MKKLFLVTLAIIMAAAASWAAEVGLAWDKPEVGEPIGYRIYQGVASGATTQFFDGLIDKAFVYNEALGESEIAAICGTTRRSRPGAILLGW